MNGTSVNNHTISHSCRQLIKIFTFQNYYLRNCSNLYSTEYWIKLQVFTFSYFHISVFHHVSYYVHIFKIQNNAHKYFSLISDIIMKKNYKDGFE